MNPPPVVTDPAFAPAAISAFGPLRIRTLLSVTVTVLSFATATVPVTMTLPSRFASSVNSRFVILTSPPFSLTLDTAWLPMSRLVISFAKDWAIPLSTEISYCRPFPVMVTDVSLISTVALLLPEKLYALAAVFSLDTRDIVLPEDSTVLTPLWTWTPLWYPVMVLFLKTSLETWETPIAWVFSLSLQTYLHSKSQFSTVTVAPELLKFTVLSTSPSSLAP